MRYLQSIFVREPEWSQNSCKRKQVGGCINFAVFEHILLWGEGGIFAWKYRKYTFLQNNTFTLKQWFFFTFPLTIPSKEVHAQNQHKEH